MIKKEYADILDKYELEIKRQIMFYKSIKKKHSKIKDDLLNAFENGNISLIETINRMKKGELIINNSILSMIEQIIEKNKIYIKDQEIKKKLYK